MRTFGIVLIVIGLIMLFVPGLDFTTREKVIDAGPIQVTADKKNEIGWPTYAGGVVAAVGLVLVVAAKKK
jgi:cytochrome c biogenesis protein CcdA